MAFGVKSSKKFHRTIEIAKTKLTSNQDLDIGRYHKDLLDELIASSLDFTADTSTITYSYERVRTMKISNTKLITEITEIITFIKKMLNIKTILDI